MLMTLNRVPCHVVLKWLTTLPSERCHSDGVFIVAKAEKKTLDQDHRQLVMMWLITLPSEPCHSGDVFMVE